MSRAVLVRKVPYCDEDQQEVYEAPWLDWIDPITGDPLTDENFGYALGTVPDGAPAELHADSFIVSETWTEEDDGIGGKVKRRTLTATYSP